MRSNGSGSIILGAVGDVFIDRPDPSTTFDSARAVLEASDVLFGNCEGVYADAYSRAPSAGLVCVAPKHNMVGLRSAGFDVLSVANNHAIDGGHGAFLEMLEAFRQQGTLTIGGGATLSESRRPAIVRSGDLSVAFLAYASVFPAGYEARDDVPGIAPARFHTFFSAPSWDAIYPPGTAPDVHVVPIPQDCEDLVSDIHGAKDQADFVIVSFHWGDPNRPAVVTKAERLLAAIAVDAGADAILGHHHHLLRGVERIRQSVVAYGLGHFGFDLPRLETRVSKRALAMMREYAGDYALGTRREYPTLPFHPDARLTVMLALTLRRGESVQADLVPFIIDRRGCPIPASAESSEGTRVLTYLKEVSRTAGFQTTYQLTGRSIGGVPVASVI